MFFTRMCVLNKAMPVYYGDILFCHNLKDQNTGVFHRVQNSSGVSAE